MALFDFREHCTCPAPGGQLKFGGFGGGAPFHLMRQRSCNQIHPESLRCGLPRGSDLLVCVTRPDKFLRNFTANVSCVHDVSEWAVRRSLRGAERAHNVRVCKDRDKSCSHDSNREHVGPDNIRMRCIQAACVKARRRSA